eukprot:1158423-Pelagomonas_calceolata.AAC.2
MNTVKIRLQETKGGNGDKLRAYLEKHSRHKLKNESSNFPRKERKNYQGSESASFIEIYYYIGKLSTLARKTGQENWQGKLARKTGQENWPGKLARKTGQENLAH